MNGDANGKSMKKSGNSGKGRIQVALLDDTVIAFDVEARVKGAELYKKVNSHLNLEESEFFGLLFSDEHSNQTWLDHLKPISRQTKEPYNTTFKFRVMFYTPDPNSLQEYTRYLFTLQVRRDLLDGRLYCSEDTGALLASYIVQGELGDYDPLSHKEGYLAGFQFVPNQTKEIEDRIVSYHRSHRGEIPAESDHNMLEIARKIEMYGITLYPAQDADGININLAVYHSGVLVFQDRNRIITDFSWANIRKLSFKKKRFLIKLHKGTNDSNTVSFNMSSRNGAKNFWKVCINHHVFFRHSKAPRLKKKASFKRGSKYKYSGRTKKEITDEASTKNPMSCDPDPARHKPRLSGSFQHHDAPSIHNANSSVGYGRQISEEEGSFSLASEPFSPKSAHADFIEDSYIGDTQQNQHKVITITHQDTIDSTTYNEETKGHDSKKHLDNDIIKPTTICDIESAPVPNNEETLEMNGQYSVDDATTVTMTNGTGDSDDLDLNISNTAKELEDEVESMFNRIKSEYGSKNTSWKYNISSVTTDSINNESDKPEADFDASNRRDVSFQTEADEDSECRLREKVKALYLQNCHVTTSYDSDSDASAVTVDDEGSAFEDDLSYASSATSSVSSIHKNRDFLHELRKYRASGKIYNIAKEILQTERTYVKDLEVLTVSFRNVVESDNMLPTRLQKLLYDNIDPLYDFHCSLLAELEERIALWENASTTEASRDSIQKIGDIMHRNMRQMKLYTSYIKKHGDVILELEKYTRKSAEFEKAYKEFEMENVCYLSINSFLLKPSQRVLYYRSMLERLTKEYGKESADAIDAKVAYEEVLEACKIIEPSITILNNLHKLVELERDLVGIEDLTHPQRLFIREGCLHKICHKGPQPRMFFLLSDILLYTSQGLTATNQFRARAQLPLRSLKVEEGGVELHGLYAFTLTGPGNKSFVVAANSPDEKQKWMNDIKTAINTAIKSSMCMDCQSNKTEFMLYVGQDNSHMCHQCQSEINQLGSMPPNERLLFWQSKYPLRPTIKRLSLEADSDDEGSYNMNDVYNSLDRRHAHSRTISTRRVCWHRNTSISMKEYTISIQNSISGELYRRHKNTHKWQKLWVVFTNFCLYFFKTSDEEAPLASLPLIGYFITKPLESEIHDEFAFKLQFKTHQYYFKADNPYSFERWFDVITTATKASNIKSRRKLNSVT